MRSGVLTAFYPVKKLPVMQTESPTLNLSGFGSGARAAIRGAGGVPPVPPPEVKKLICQYVAACSGNTDCVYRRLNQLGKGPFWEGGPAQRLAHRMPDNPTRSTEVPDPTPVALGFERDDN